MKERFVPYWPKLPDYSQPVPYNFLFWEPNIPGLTRPLIVASDQCYPKQRLVCASQLSAAAHLFAMRLLDDYHPIRGLHRKISVVEIAETVNGQIAKINYGIPTMKILQQVARPLFEDSTRTIFENSKTSVGIHCDRPRPIFFTYKATSSVRFPEEQDEFWYKVAARATDIVHDWTHRKQFVLGHPYVSHKSEAQAITASLRFLTGTGVYPHLVRPGLIPEDVFEWECERQRTLYRAAASGNSHLNSHNHLMTEGLEKIILPDDDDPMFG